MGTLPFDNRKVGLTKKELAYFRPLTTPWKIQDTIDLLRPNYEKNGPTLKSVREILKDPQVQCVEGALLAACALWILGRAPLVVDLRATKDSDHVFAVFREGAYWGAISKSNHAMLRWRDPVFCSVRELVTSYFHEYINTKGEKTLRSHSRPFDLSRVDPRLWVTGGRECWDIGAILDDLPHAPLFPASHVKTLRPLDPFAKRISDIAELR